MCISEKKNFNSFVMSELTCVIKSHFITACFFCPQRAVQLVKENSFNWTSIHSTFQFMTNVTTIFSISSHIKRVMNGEGCHNNTKETTNMNRNEDLSRVKECLVKE